MRTVVFSVLCALLTASALGDTSITINSRTISSSGSHISADNNVVIVDGKVVSGNLLEGSGKIAIEKRNLGEFETLHLDISADVTVVKGKKSKCVITADDNILPVILTEYGDNGLRIYAKKSFSSRQRVEIAIETPILEKAENNGSGKIAVEGVLKGRANLVISGSGDIVAKGHVVELIATINGSGNLRAADLEARNATVIINGSGDAVVHATASLTAKVNGSGNIKYAGTPSELSTSVKGSGKISTK